MSVQSEPSTALPDAMTDLEERLRSAEGSSIKSDVIARLSLLEARIDQSVRDGLPPADFAKAGPVLDGLRAARDLVAHFPTVEP